MHCIGDLDLDSRTILKWILEIYDMFMSTEFSWLIYDSSAGLWKDSNKTLISQQRGISWPADQL
jgi:hypothetical protein